MPKLADESKASRGIVVVHSSEGRSYAESHERFTHAEIARRIAALKGFAFAGEYARSRRYPGPVFYVPSDTLSMQAAEELGIRTELDLFGGVVPEAVASTKAIAHPLVEPSASAPSGWSREFGQRVREAVLLGFCVFTPEDARRAAARLLEKGPLRIKPVRATGGRGQLVARELAAAEAALSAVESAELSRHGLVLEENLDEVTTYSVGQVRVAGHVASYYGTQRLTPDNTGAMVYGGSDLVVARGDFDALLALDMPNEARRAVAQARTYDSAATACFPGMFASRRNYDVAHGVDSQGRERSGVLEHSWCIGGASSAEIVALEAFQSEPALQAVRASCVERYGEGETPPQNATVWFRGIDERVGPILKYTLVGPHVDAR